jgi:glycosyltransferase involved in cell wall biosynthesis
MSLASRSFLSSARVSATWTRPLNPATWVANLWSGSRQGKGRSRSVRHWAINGDYVTLRPTGVARYAREVTLQLDALMAERHPLTRGLHLELIAPRDVETPFAHIPSRVVREFSHPRLPQFWVQMQLPAHVKGGLLSFCNLAPVAVSRHIVCIHDLHTRLMPESYGLLFRLAHRAILPLLGRRAARITTVSGLSREHLVHYGIAPRSKIVVTHNGSDHTKHWNPDRSELPAQSSRRPFVLCLGRPQKYKNAELLLRLAPMLDQMGLDLWMAGDIDISTLRKVDAHVPGNVVLLGRISDDDFAHALGHALAFLFPSRIEGFGLPAIEAMALGCPVVASTSPCLPEVCGDGALFADPDDPNAWLRIIENLKVDGAFRERTIHQGRTRAAAYSWRKIAESYLKLMAEVDGVGLAAHSEMICEKAG